jgi:hypothetical protein
MNLRVQFSPKLSKQSMKTKTKIGCAVVLLTGIVAVLPVARAQAPALRVLAQTNDGGAPKEERRIMVREVRKGGATETVPVIGVMTEVVPASLASQLGLAEGTGLVVKQVVSGSPASAVLKTHDILLKLDDQLLMDMRQLSMLLRMRKENDEVTLTYLRGGKQATAKVKLGVQEVPKLAMRAAGTESMSSVHIDTQGAGRQEVDRILSLIDERRRSGKSSEGGPDVRIITMNTANSTMVFSDDQGSMELTSKDGKKTLVAKDAKGAVIFDGPITTAEERKALPPAVAERLGKLEAMKEFEFKTGEDFKGSEVKIVPVPGQKIALPPAPRAPGRVTPSF